MDPLLVAIHVPVGLAVVLAGIVAMVSRKGATWHRRAGLVYLIGILILFVSATGLVLVRGPQFLHLFVLGALAAACALLGYLGRRRQKAVHIAGMGSSYILMLTAFYVDNGPKLPFWEMFPPVVFWIGPALIGVPLIFRAISGRRCVPPLKWHGSMR